MDWQPFYLWYEQMTTPAPPTPEPAPTPEAETHAQTQALQQKARHLYRQFSMLNTRINQRKFSRHWR